jgi:hypothetical protein
MTVRGEKVLLDSDLAMLYGVTAAMKTNLSRAASAASQRSKPRQSHLTQQRPHLPPRALWVLPLLLMVLRAAGQSEDYTYETNNAAITITAYTGPGGEVSIPSTINGLPVTSIGEFAFAYRTSLTNITMGDSVATIETGAFEGCSSLTSVILPNSLTNIGSVGFYGCSGLTNIVIPDDVTTVGGWAFLLCSSLTNISIGHSVSSIGDQAFGQCSSLMAITVDKANTSYSSLDGVLFNGSRTGLIQCPGAKAADYTLPGTVITIANWAFQCCSALTSISIPDSVSSIGDEAFSFCTSLTNVTIGTNVTNIGTAVFGYSTSLTAITVDTPNSAFSSLAGVLFNKSQTTLIQYPGGKIGSYTIPNTVTNIGTYACASCTSLTSVSIASSVASIEDSAFASCTALTNATMGNNLTTIGHSAFSYCTALTSIATGNSVTVIGAGAFESCYSLTNVIIGNSVTSIGDSAFFHCTSLATVTLGSSVATIGATAFRGCYSLAAITIPNTVTNIGSFAFSGCTGLTAITVDAANSAYSSSAGVLFDKSQTTLLQCPGGRTGAYTVPASVALIVTYAFSDCGGLEGLYFQGNSPHFEAGPPLPGGTSPLHFTVYYRPGTTGWSAQVQTSGASFGMRSNSFGFTIIGNSSLGVLVEACTNLAAQTWLTVTTNTLPGGSSYFSDVQCISYPRRFYRLRCTSFGGRPMALWDPQVQTSAPSFGVRTNRFGFNIIGTADIPIVLEACSNLANPAWVSLKTCTITNGSIYFSDPAWVNYPRRFYSIRSP